MFSFKLAAPSLLTGLIGFGMVACTQDETATRIPEDPVARRAAEYCGLEKWNDVERLQYTFHVRKAADEPEMSRAWTWEPKTGKVTLRQEGKEPLTYFRHQLAAATTDELEADKAFINDQYWLLFPLRLAWDEGASLESTSGKEPVSGVDCDVVRVTYNATDGYTPGDVYELYVDAEGKALGWSFFPGGAADPARVTQWLDYETFGPLNLSLRRPAADGGFQIRFSDVVVDTTAS